MAAPESVTQKAKSLRDVVISKAQKLFAPLPQGLSTTELLYLILQRLMTIFSPVPNREKVKTFQQIVKTSGIAVALPNIGIPDGFSVVVKAMKGNSNNITVGGSAGDANHKGTSFVTLTPGDAVEFFVKNANAIWIDAISANDGVEGTVEV